MIRIKPTLIFPGKTPRGMANAAKEARQKANLSVAEFWREKLFPKHFTTQGAQEYGYQPRTAKYQARKFRRFGHSNPLTYTGESKENTMSQYVIKVSPNRLEVRMPSPRAWNLSRRANMPNLREEALKASDSDLEILAKVAFKTFKETMDKSGSRPDK